MADAGFIADLSTAEAEAVFACYVTEILRATSQRTQTLSNLPGGSGHLPGGSLRPLNANLATSLTHSALEAFRALPCAPRVASLFSFETLLRTWTKSHRHSTLRWGIAY